MNSVLIKKILISLILVMFLATVVFAAKSFADDAFDIETYKTKSEKAGEAENMARTAVGSVMSITKIVTLGIAIIMLAILGMKYMMASAGDRAEIKKHAVVYVVGAVIMFGASAILQIIEKFADNLS